MQLKSVAFGLFLLFSVAISGVLNRYDADAQPGQTPGAGNGMRLTAAASPNGPYFLFGQPGTPAPTYLPGASRFVGGVPTGGGNVTTPLHEGIPGLGGTEADTNSASVDLNDMSYSVVARYNFFTTTTTACGAAPGIQIYSVFFCTGTSGLPGAAVSHGGGTIVAGDGASVGVLLLSNSLTLTRGYVNPTTVAPIGLVMYFRWSQLGAAAATRRCGLSINDLSAVPADGVWWEHAAGGAYTMRMRSGGVDRINTASGISAAVDTLHTMTIRFDGVTWTWRIDGTIALSSSPGNTPNANMVFTCWSGTASNLAGITLKYIDLRFAGSPL